MNRSKLVNILKLFEPANEVQRNLRTLSNYGFGDLSSSLQDLVDESTPFTGLIIELFDLPEDNSIEFIDNLEAGQNPYNSPALFAKCIDHDYLGELRFRWEDNELTTEELADEILEYVSAFKKRKDI